MKGFKTRTAGTLLTRFRQPGVTLEDGRCLEIKRLTCSNRSGLSTSFSNRHDDEEPDEHEEERQSISR